jgi:hypothetical protein
VTASNTPARRSTRKGTDREASSRNSINAGLGGVGGGTGLVAIADRVGVHTVLGQVLIYSAPAITVIAGALLYQLKLRADWFNEQSQVKRARKVLEAQLRSPHASEEHKAEIRLMLEELDRSVAAA